MFRFLCFTCFVNSLFHRQILSDRPRQATSWNSFVFALKCAIFMCEDLWSVRGCIFISDFLFCTSLKYVPHFIFLFGSGFCSRGLQGLVLILPCAEVCDLNHYLWGDVTCQKPITPFVLFIPAGSMIRCTKYMFVPFHFLFSPWKIQKQTTRSLFSQRKKLTAWQTLPDAAVNGHS